jgi:hypothetical protein
MTRFVNNDEDLGKVYMYNNDFTLDRVITKTRKDHHCAMCESNIQVGLSCNYTVGSSGGQFFYYHSHIKCSG